MNVAVVGAGIAGLLASFRLRGVSVDIYERLKGVGLREHCTGVVSTLTAARIAASDFTENFYDRMLIAAGNVVAHLAAKRPFACRIKRCEHEKYLADIVESAGHRVLLRHEVLAVRSRERGVELVYRNGSIVTKRLYDYVIIAEGYPNPIARECGFNPQVEVLQGLQVELELSSALPEQLVTTLVVVLGLGGDGFSWTVPLSRRRVLVGVAVKEQPHTFLEAAVRAFLRSTSGHARRRKLFGGLVLRGYPRELKRGRLLALGDANAMVKSLSGGGLYPISEAANCIASIIEGKSTSSNTLLRVLKRQYFQAKLVYGLLRLLSALPLKALEVTARLAVDPLTYDRHDIFVIKSAKGLPSSLKLLLSKS